jgi:filamentous hemagglutinin
MGRMSPSSRARRRLLATSAIGLAVGRALLLGDSGRGAQLPVPCGPGSCAANNTPGFSAPAGFVTSGKATGVQAGNTFTVSQASNQAILNWASFNVSADGKVIFQQPGQTSIALNKIYQASPSSIFGELTANGQIYLINPNGMVFGATSKVNVAGLIASSLGLAQGDAGLANGILAPISSGTPGPALQSDGRVYVTDSSGNLVLDAQGHPQPVAVVVQPGAQMTAADGGRLMLAGQSVTNGGSLAAPDGQVVLASGQSVYLAASTDPAVRGLIVEVSGAGVTTNQAGGSLSAARGNVSLIGMAVNQSGRISATTAVSANGSVILQAAQGSPQGQGRGCQTNELLCANEGGTLTIGPTSGIEVAPDPTDTTTAVVGETQLPATVKLIGEQIDIHGGQINAPAGQLTVLAASNPDAGLASAGNGAAQIRVDTGTSINLAGSVAQLPMSANLITLQLRANELEDDPAQRNGPLHGTTVIVDTRDGKPPIISSSSWQSALQGIEENILQRTALGGSASFRSEGDIVVSSGATINVSGGQWDYAAGLVQTSWLISASGQAYNISGANPLLPYTSVLNPTYTQAYPGFGVQITGTTPGLSTQESGYVQGFSAGSVQFAAPAMSLQGTLVGTAVNGPYQRSLSAVPAGSLATVLASVNGTSPIATGGTLVIGGTNFATSSAIGLPQFFAPPLSFATSVAPIIVADGTPLPPQPLQLPVSYLSNGFAQTKIYDDTSVTLPAGLPLNLGAGGALLVQAPRVVIDSSIEAPGGTIALNSVQTASYPTTGAPRLGIDIGTGVTLDVRGQWTNDSALQSLYSPTLAPTYQNGGTIALSLTSPLSTPTFGGELSIGNDVSLRASGGAWILPNNTIVGGAGGQISLDATPYQSALELGRHVELDAFGVQGAQGGAFTLGAPRITVGPGGTWAGAQSVDSLANPTQAFQVGAGLFSQNGFSSITLLAAGPESTGTVNGDVLTVSAGTAITAQAESLQLASGYLMRPTGGTVEDFSQAQLLPVSHQKPYSITLEVAPSVSEQALQNFSIGALDIQSGASVSLNPNAGSGISLIGQGSVLIDGKLRAPGGTITAQLQAPNLVLDPGYLPDQLIELESHGVLDVSGAVVLTPNSQNLNLGTVLAGGTVNLQAFRGQVVADAGSQIDIAGASAPLTVPTIGGVGGYANATLGSAGGTLLVQSVESASLLGTLSAAGGASSAGTVFAGTLELDLTQSLFSHNGSITTPLPTTPPTIDIVSSVAGSTPTAPYGNLAVLGVSQLEESGIDVLRLRADSAVNINTSTPLKLGRMISLDAPNIGVSYGTQARLEAPYIAFTDSNSAVTGTGAPLSGIGSLTVSAAQIALSGFTTLQGIGSLTLHSSGDLTFVPLFRNQVSGALALSGDLTIDAARVYPATIAAYTIVDSLDGGTVRIGQTSASPGTPLSVGGSLTIEASNIASSGTLLAPFGQITLNASDSLALLDGSVTSVSANGALLPYGQTLLNQAEWIYLASPSASESQMAVRGVPTRQVSLTAPQMSFARGATIDVTGGGDFSAYEWVPGTGGSVDALGQQSASSNGLFAVLPSTRGQYAAYDIQEFTGSAVTPGASVYLSGAAGLPAGVYPLLPARYGLMPGAYLVQVESGFQSLKPGTIGALADGTPVIAGYLSFGNTALQSAAGYSGFAIYPGSYSQSLAEYQLSYASTFFNKPPPSPNQPPPLLPADAGTLLIAAGSTLSALGKVESQPGNGGSAATIEISATDLTVTAGSQGSASTGVSIGAPVISSWNAGDLLLGGQLSADGSTINVSANSVTIGQGAQFTAGQVLAVANQSIEVQSGARVSSTSGSGTAPKSPPASLQVSLANPDGSADSGAALLAVSDTSLPVAVRPTGTSGGGVVQIDSGAALSTRGAVALDAPAGVSVAGTINAPGASWSLASGSIALGSGASSDTLHLTPALLQEMQSAGQIQLSSLGSIDLLSPVTLGTNAQGVPTLGALTLSAASINNSGGTSTFGGKSLTLSGVAGAAASPTAGSGTLGLIANTLTLGTGTLTINGNAQTSIQAQGGVTGQDTGTVAIGGNLTLTTPQLTAASGSATTLASSGTLQLVQSGTAAAPSTLAASLGGSLTLQGGAIQDGGTIIEPGGRISLLSSGDITLTPQAVVDASGITVSAVNQTVGAAGGIVDISAVGNLTVPAGATVSVAGAGNAPAGSLALAAGQAVTVEGNLLGNATPNAIGGSFTLYAGQLAGGFSGLAGILGTGGFTNQVAVRVQNGDLDVTAGTTLTANQISLTADSGRIDVAGSLSAPSAGQRGSIGLFAAHDVVLEPGSILRADGSGAAGRGGEIELSTVSGTLSLESGSVVSATGSAQTGTLLLRAPAITSTGDVAINSIDPATVSGVGQVTIEPVSVYTYAQIGDPTANFGQIQSALQSYLSQALTVIPGRFPIAGSSGTPTLIVQPGVEFQAGSVGAPPVDLTLSQPLDLYAQQLGAPIDFTVRATGNLTLNGTISDGMVGDSLPATAAPSSSLRFVAGADLSSANPLATLPQLGPPSAGAATGANLVLAPGVLVRTGTGDISLVAANDVQFGAGSSAYTSGVAAAPPASVRLGGGNIGTITFAGAGGNVVVNAGGDVVGNAVTVAISDWQLRNIGKAGTAAEWGVDLAAFDSAPWTLATFGGGDLHVTAGRDALNVSAAAADSQPLPAVAGTTAPHFASGGLTLGAGRDVVSGQFLVADGIGTLSAGRSFATNLTSAAGAPVGSLFALEDAQLSVWAQGDIAIDALLNPTVLFQQRATAGAISNAVFFTYGAGSAFNAQSSSGTLTFNNLLANIDQLLGQTVESNTTQQSGGLFVYPANLRLASLTKDIVGASGNSSASVLYPSGAGQLQLFAGRDISGLELRVSDAADSQIATAANPSFGAAGVVAVSEGNNFYSSRHLNDPAPTLVVAGRDIDGIVLSSPKAGEIAAGRDILNLQYQGEGLNANDVTLLVAGRDFSDPEVFGDNGFPVAAPGVVQVGGPGRLDILAGRNIDLGLSVGVTTVGNLFNPNLATATGGNITLMAGLGQNPDYTGFYKTIVAPSSVYQPQLIAYTESVTGLSGLTLAQAEAEFTSFTPSEQRPFIDGVFFNELTLSGVEANQVPSPGFTRGYTAIDALFPGSHAGGTGPASPYSGNLKLTYSEIYTLAGGTIDLLVPGGAIDVGVANPPSSGNVKPPSQLGIVAQGAGNVDIYSLGDVNVETSRIFTLGGGNILIWSNDGNIDAGNGAKSSLSLPPPTYGVDSAGNVILVFNAAVAGSGIRTIQTTPTEPAGNVDLIAPVGTVNAGDAGIGAAGNINIAAVSVVGAGNINFGGAATGVPPAVSGVTAALSGAAATAASVSTTATTSLEASATSEQAAPLTQSAISWLDVFVTGLGEENCKPDDLECLKRQKHD